MNKNPKDLQRYTAPERANHWMIAITFILLALSGLALFHPLFWPLSSLFGGGTWTRILHPYIGLLMALSFLGLFARFAALNAMTPTDREWLGRVGEMASGNDSHMPASGKYNGGQKLLFWALTLCMLLLAASGLVIWRAWFDLPVGMVRLGVVVHAAVAAFMIGLITMHVYAAIWVKGSIRAMLHGTVTRAWARQHHRGWYRQLTGK